jgi:hypothetical protein
MERSTEYKKVTNSITLYGNIIEQCHSKTKQTAIYNVYFKIILTFNSEMWTLIYRHKNKIQIMDIKF